jgi:hypothetical protein
MAYEGGRGPLLKHAPLLQAGDLPVVAQAVPPANYTWRTHGQGPVRNLAI